MRRTQDLIGRTFRRIDVTIRIVAVTPTAIGYAVPPSPHVYHATYEVFELWFEGATDVTETKGGDS